MGTTYTETLCIFAEDYCGFDEWAMRVLAESAAMRWYDGRRR